MDDILALLGDLSLEPITLAQLDTPAEPPLTQIHAMIRGCSGGLVIGFCQETADRVTRPGREAVAPKPYPSPWNHLEAGLLFAADVPLLILKEAGITGGVFDDGVSGHLVHTIDDTFRCQDSHVRSLFSKWQGDISHHFYAT
ncbi:MAG: hypothetical protein RLN72_15475 [Henriciella sp.]